ncbi:Kinesin-like protein [Actinidia chinensis var. chinensis]|uniref:Kinesin-like protein n=1 Tax=Actinidia chinensis var. chinensis TaxID=1590841 RepID=A0A2R6P4S3_ACTCC|nr:Kinesin-like protein [Actinidia chinensis var. chinensis]
MSENRFLGSISASSIRNLFPKSVSTKRMMHSPLSKSRPDSENIPPIDPNVQIDNGSVLPSIPKQSLSNPLISHKEIARSDSQKKEELSTPLDPPVKVVVRIRPANGHEREGDWLVRKVSDDSVTVGDRKFTFDSVLDSKSNQEDVFELVGVPLVKNALAGYNTSILAYGQTGSGKTYTMWGPPSAMVEGQEASSHQGIVPRIFQMLFSKIQQDQENSEGRQINYQCRCSFLEIYNEQIGDLLDPTHRNLEIKDDAKHGFYVENLTEEYVTSYEDVTQILIKGLSSRKVGATSINSKSSRSHIVFTCVIESWCKERSSKCFGSSKTSRISLVDLAGLDTNKLDDAGRQSVKEEKNVKKSLSHLGHFVNILAEGAQSGKPRDISYRNSSLTQLLQESLGGNVKLAVICAISPDSKTSCEILSTLRFGQRVKSILNEPLINEISEDDVNDLSDQIRQLKEELIRAKSNVCNSVGSNYGYSKGQRSVRESLNQLRVSLNRSLILPRIDDDAKEVVNVNEDDVRELRLQLDNLHSSGEESIKGTYEKGSCIQFSSVEKSSDTDLTSEHYGSCVEECEIEENSLGKSLQREESSASVDSFASEHNISRTIDTALRSSCVSISSSRHSPALQDPMLSESPKIKSHRKSITFASTHMESQNTASDSSKFDSDVLRQSPRQSNHIRSSLQSSKIFPGPTESLAASLQRGLEIIDLHQRNSASITPSIVFSFEHLALKSCPTLDKANASVQTLPEERPSSHGASASFLCVSCRRTGGLSRSTEVEDSLKTWMAAADEEGTSNGSIAQVAKYAEKDSSEATRREKELENICMEQAAKIEQLNFLVEQYKHDKKQNSIPELGNTLRLEDSNNEIIQIDGIENEKFHPPEDERKLLRWDDSESHEQEIIKEKYEIKEVREETHSEHRTASFDINEKESLLNEIQSLKNKLQSFTNGSPKPSFERVRSSLSSQSIQLRKSVAFSQGNNEEELEKERQRWMEMESDWISLTDELRIDLESNRRRAEKVEMELRLEKKCTEELDDALHRSVLGHARMVEHYADLQEKYNYLVGKHRLIMEGIAEVKKAAAKAGAKGQGSRFAKSLAAELSVLRVERAREMELLKKENKSLKIQLRDTAEAVHAAGELLVRLREAEEAASVAEENFTKVQEENDKLKKQVEKLKRKHKMEMITMKQYLAESRLPESALRPLYREDSDVANTTSSLPDDDQAWRAEFGAVYQNHY